MGIGTGGVSMRKHLSVLMLAARSTIYKVMGLFVVMGVTESALFFFALQKTLAAEPLGLEQLISQSRIGFVCGISFLLLCGLLSLTGCEFGGSKLRYTLQRLSVPEKVVVFWWAGYNAVCFFLFWVVQLAIALLLSRLYATKMHPAYVSGQTIWLAFYRNSWLHSLLPLAETSRYLRNIIFVLSLGISASCFSWRQRHDQRGIAVVAVAMMVLVYFSRAMGSFASDLLLSVVAVIIAAGAVIGMWEGAGYEHRY